MKWGQGQARAAQVMFILRRSHPPEASLSVFQLAEVGQTEGISPCLPTRTRHRKGGKA
jgi:hypothetical protein